MRIAKKVQNHNKGGSKEQNLVTKMKSYNRQKMMEGLDHKNANHKEVMRTLGALDQINMRENKDVMTKRLAY